MKVRPAFVVCVVAAAVSGGSFLGSAAEDSGHYNKIARQQVPNWSKEDLNFFLHGSMSTEVVPEAVLRAFIKTYPVLFPSSDLTHLGLIPDEEFGWPIGFSRKNVPHLGGMSAVGINCASCHVAQITSTSEKEPIRILGVTSHFNVEAFYGSVLVATFKTSDPENMKKFLLIYLGETGEADGKFGTIFHMMWQKQQSNIVAVMAADPFAAKDLAPGDLHKIDNADLHLGKKGDLAV